MVLRMRRVATWVVLLMSHVMLIGVLIAVFAARRRNISSKNHRLPSPSTPRPILSFRVTPSPSSPPIISTPSPTTSLPSVSPTTKMSTVTTAGPTLSPSKTKSLAPETSSTHLHLLAYYYPWYIRNDWSQYGYIDTPLLGLYGTDDPSVAEHHIRWAHRAGVKGFVMSWWGPNAVTAKHMEQGFLQASNIGDIHWCINYETLGALPTTDFANETLALDALKRDFQQLESRYFSHPSYYRINGRPVVVIYVTRTWQNFERWMLEELQDSLQEEVYIIADEPFFDKQNNPTTARNGLREGASLFDAYTTYNMFENALTEPGESARDFMVREARPIFEAWSQDTLFFPNVLPMYHDFRGHEPLSGDSEGLRIQLELFSCLTRPDWVEVTVPRLLFVTSWNEWWEGSEVEPDDANRYGFEYIDTLRNFTRDFPVNCSASTKT